MKKNVCINVSENVKKFIEQGAKKSNRSFEEQVNHLLKVYYLKFLVGDIK